VSTGFKPGCDAGFFVVPSCFELGRQPGYALHGLFLSWRPEADLRVDLTVDNLTNKAYRTSGFGGGIGTLAPGRDVRLSVSYRF
jgi:outer membrane receptor protein involved in Fe transport